MTCAPGWRRGSASSTAATAAVTVVEFRELKGLGQARIGSFLHDLGVGFGHCEVRRKSGGVEVRSIRGSENGARLLMMVVWTTGGRFGLAL